MSGLTAARQLLDAGRSVRVIDKGRGVGGRLATRRLSPKTTGNTGNTGNTGDTGDTGDTGNTDASHARIDHGAQFFTTRSNEFVELAAEAQAAGAVEEWCRGFGEGDGYPRYRGESGMTSLAKWLAEGVQVELSQTVVDLVQYPADAYILAMPVPQALSICSFSKCLPPPQLQRDLARIDYHPVIALLATFAEPLSVPEPGGVQQPDHPIITFIADNQRKGISPIPALTLHASHQWSMAHWLEPDEPVIAELLAAAADVVGGAQPTATQLQRWRYAGPVQPWPDPMVTWGAGVPGDPQIVLSGDAFGSSKVEGAFLSGRAAAAAILDR